MKKSQTIKCSLSIFLVIQLMTSICSAQQQSPFISQVWTSPLKDMSINGSKIDYTIIWRKSRLILAHEQQFLSSVDTKSGEIQWQCEFEYSQESKPCTTSSSLVLIGKNNSLFGLNPITGKNLWETDLTTKVLAIGSNSDSIIVIQENQVCSSINPETGFVIWEKKLPARFDEYGKFIVTADRICVALENKIILCLAHEDGDTIWERQIPNQFITPIVADAQSIYNATSPKSIQAYSLSTGNPLWKKANQEYGVLLPFALNISNEAQPMVVSGNYLLISGQQDLPLLGVLNTDTESIHIASIADSKPTFPPLLLDGNALYFCGNNLFSYDLHNSKIKEYIPNSGGLQIIAQLGTSVFLIHDGFLKKGRINPTRFHEFNEITVNWLTAEDIIFYSSLFLLFVGVIGFTMKTKPSLPPTHESDIRVTSILTIYLLMIVVGLCSSWHIIMIYPSGNNAIQSLLFIMILSMPALLALLNSAMLFFEKWQIKKTSQLNPANLDPHIKNEIVEIFNKLKQGMEIVSKVLLYFTSEQGASPRVAGGLTSKAIIIFPASIYNLIKAACAGQPNLIKPFIRLILAHELAHVRNRDIRVGPFLDRAFMQIPLIANSIVVLFLLIATLLFPLDIQLATIALPASIFISVSSIFLYFLIKDTINAREKLTDATASLFVEPEAIRKLCELNFDIKPPESILDQFRKLLSVARKSKRQFERQALSFMDMDCPASIEQKINNAIQNIFSGALPTAYSEKINTQSHGQATVEQNAGQRADMLLNKRMLFQKDEWPTITSSCISGMLAAFLAGGSLICLGLLAPNWSLIQMDELPTLKKSQTILPQLMASLFPILAAIIMGSHLLFTLRELPVGVQNITRRNLLQLLIGLICSYVFFEAGLKVLGFGFALAKQDFDIFKFYFNDTYYWYLAFSVLFGFFLIVRCTIEKTYHLFFLLGRVFI